MPRTVNKEDFFTAARKFLGDGVNTITRQQIIEVCEENGLVYPQWFVNDPANRKSRGVYIIDNSEGKPDMTNQDFDNSIDNDNDNDNDNDEDDVDSGVSSIAMMAQASYPNGNSLIPQKIPGYVRFGNYKDLREIIKSRMYYSAFITGLSGNGKTLMVEQICATLKRELIRVNVTIETDEDDLLGGFRMVQGQTVWHDGPVVQAMERGAVLLLDEVDLGSHKLMCLQPILEGNPVFLKKVGRLVRPAPGFNIIATANTKGKGSDDGRFVGTNVMNEAFLERFSVTFEQDYPPPATERKILNSFLANLGYENEDSFVNRLVEWGGIIRDAFNKGGEDEIITTRRLKNICQAYVIFDRNRMRAIELCLNRFSEETKKSFLDLYKKVDATIDPIVEEQQGPSNEVNKEAAELASGTSSSSDGELSHEDIKNLLSSDDWFNKIQKNVTS